MIGYRVAARRWVGEMGHTTTAKLIRNRQHAMVLDGQDGAVWRVGWKWTERIRRELAESGVSVSGRQVGLPEGPVRCQGRVRLNLERRVTTQY